MVRHFQTSRLVSTIQSDYVLNREVRKELAYPCTWAFRVTCFLLATPYTTFPVGLAGIVFRIVLLNNIPKVDGF
jgi:hypothetical protein